MVESKEGKRYSISTDGLILTTSHSPSTQVKAAASQVVDLNGHWEKKTLCPTVGGPALVL